MHAYSITFNTGSTTPTPVSTLGTTAGTYTLLVTAVDTGANVTVTLVVQ